MIQPLASSLAAASLLVGKTRLRVCCCVAAVFLAGCAALDTHQAKLDQKQLRDVLMDYTDEQILDNLIRASNGLPIVHFDLSNVTGSVTSKFTPSVGGSRIVTNVRSRTPTDSTVTTGQTTTNAAGETVVNTVARTLSVVGGVIDTVAKPFNLGISAERGNAISVQADPLLDDPEVYAAYIRFLNTDTATAESQSATDSREADVTMTTRITTEPATTRKMVMTEPTSGSSPAQSQTAPAVITETTEFAEASSTTEETKPKTKPPRKPQLVIGSFDSIKSLRKASLAPPRAGVLVGPKLWKDGMYYWVPKRYQKQFFALCMATVARGASPDGATERDSDAVKALKENSAILRRQELR